jgi:hypothetical protein
MQPPQGAAEDASPKRKESQEAAATLELLGQKYEAGGVTSCMPKLPLSEAAAPAPAAPASAAPGTPEKTQLRDWEILTTEKESKNNFREMLKTTPRQMKEQVMKLQPTFEEAKAKAGPALNGLVKRTMALQGRYSEQTDEALKVGFACAMLFAGGRFPMTVACTQSFQMVSWEKLQSSWRELRDTFTASSRQRNLKDVGLVDVRNALGALLLAKSTSDREVAKNHLMAMASCLDPEKLRNLLRGIWPGVLAVLATLRSRFAFAVGLGVNIGETMSNTLQRVLQERFDQLSSEKRRWSDAGLQQTCGLVSFCFSFYLARVMNALNSSLYGSAAISKVLFQYFKSQQSLPESNRSTVGKCVVPLLGSDSTRRGKEEELWELLIPVSVRLKLQHLTLSHGGCLMEWREKGSLRH